MAFKPVAERAVADLVMVLQEIDKGGRGEFAAGFPAQSPATMRRSFALIDKARPQCARDIVKRGALVVAVIAVGFGGQQHMPGVMIVVVPLRAVFAARRVLHGIQCARAVVVVLEHEMDVAAGLRGKLAHCDAEIMQHRDFALLGDGVHCVQAQPVEAIFAQPIQHILDREGAHLRHPVIDGAAPGRLCFRKEARRISAEVISLGAEVIIDHVEQYHQPAQMRLINQGLEIVGASIGTVRRIPQHAVIAPITRPCEICQRHQFQRGDTGGHQMIELADHGTVGAIRCEGADMAFEHDGFLPRASAPVRSAPLVGAVIDHFAWA